MVPWEQGMGQHLVPLIGRFIMFPVAVAVGIGTYLTILQNAFALCLGGRPIGVYKLTFSTIRRVGLMSCHVGWGSSRLGMTCAV